MKIKARWNRQDICEAWWLFHQVWRREEELIGGDMMSVLLQLHFMDWKPGEHLDRGLTALTSNGKLIYMGLVRKYFG